MPNNHNSFCINNEIRRLTAVMFYTLDCNMRCKYCYIPFQKDSMMKESTVNNVINQLKIMREKGINITYQIFGGEPTLNKELILKTLDKLKDTDFEIILNTNMLEYHEDIYDKLWEIPNNVKLQVSVDGIFFKSNSNKIIENVERFLNKKKYYSSYFSNKILHLQSTIISESVPYLFKMYKWAIEKGVKSLGLIPVVEYEWKKEDESLFYKEFERIYKLIKDYYLNYSGDNPAVFYGLAPGLGFCRDANNKIYGCGAYKSIVAITPSEEVYPCHRLFAKKVGKIGQLENDTLINYEEKGKVIYDEQIKGCDNCKNNMYCNKCLAANIETTGSMYISGKRHCNITHIMSYFWSKIFSELIDNNKNYDKIAEHYLNIVGFYKNFNKDSL